MQGAARPAGTHATLDKRNRVGDSAESLAQEEVNDTYPSTWL